MPRERFYLYVPYEEKDKAKTLGALWDNKAKRFYVPAYLDKAIFATWHNPPQKHNIDLQQAQAQFQLTLQQKGLIVDEVIMNGKIQRCKVSGDKGSEKSGAYVGFLDEYPSGYIENFKSGIKINWEFKQENATLKNNFNHSIQYETQLTQK